jgi:hypothetical protein
VQDVFDLQFTAFAVFQPFLSGLITSGIKLPGYLRYIGKILFIVYPNPAKS